MEILKVFSHKELIDNIEGLEKAWLLLYKNENESSVCALENLSVASNSSTNVKILSADVSVVRDIHTQYDIKSVPTLIQFEKGNVINIIKGCQSDDYYKNLIEENTFFKHAEGDQKEAVKRVTVYSTPTCSWCNTLKTHLRKNNIRFTDIDVSKDQSAAQAMVSKSGQQGVPQTDINGEIIVGFDKTRINKLLNIEG
ncbi:MAG: thioredoxin family protein [Bacteroidales bacterium]|nr:thioredoxin family protein [Bacteroidales bacterium]